MSVSWIEAQTAKISQKLNKILPLHPGHNRWQLLKTAGRSHKFFIFLLFLFMFSACYSSDDSSTEKNKDDYNITCKCKDLENEPVKAASSISEAHAKLVAGALCVALKPEKEIALKKEEDLSVEEAFKIQSILNQTLQDALQNTPDKSVLDTIDDCTTN